MHAGPVLIVMSSVAFCVVAKRCKTGMACRRQNRNVRKHVNVCHFWHIYKAFVSISTHSARLNTPKRKFSPNGCQIDGPFTYSEIIGKWLKTRQAFAVKPFGKSWVSFRLDSVVQPHKSLQVPSHVLHTIVTDAPKHSLAEGNFVWQIGGLCSPPTFGVLRVGYSEQLAV